VWQDFTIDCAHGDPGYWDTGIGIEADGASDFLSFIDSPFLNSEIFE